VDLPETTIAAARPWPVRRRTAAWFVLHLVAGVVGSTLVLVAGPVMAMLLGVPFSAPGPSDLQIITLNLPRGAAAWWVPLAGILLFLAAIYAVAGLGALLARLAPLFLGPSAADRIAELDRRSRQLIERTRLARELHDSIGHALTVTTLQAGAAQAVADTDPAFVRAALRTIEDTGRAALEELDLMLGVLREDQASTTPQRTLADLPELLTSTGLELDSTVTGDLGAVRPVVSREAYRIVQEALTNCLRHGAGRTASVRVTVHRHRTEIDIRNPLGTQAPHRPEGRGLTGMRERVHLLGGTFHSGPDGDRWRVSAELPTP
jgi:signal transduction histidine kinase